ncbi:MAG: DUF2752 domain-containing protein [Planctomycetota bacterium]|nr:DUF2752 domain-containing protein [Planctomycetota bacterium]
MQPRRETAVRIALLGSALAVSVTASLGPDGARWYGIAGPACPLGSNIDPVACPGCGLLRSTAASLQGEMSYALLANPAGPMVALLLVAGLLLNLDILRRGSPSQLHQDLRRRGHTLLVASVFAGWTLRILRETL